MKPSWKRYFVFLCFAIAGIWLWSANYPLQLFAWKISGADRVELTAPTTASGNEIKVTLTNAQAKALIECLTSSARDSHQYKAKFSFKASFFRGPNPVGSIYFCGSLFLIANKQYRDPTDRFRQLTQKPLMDAYAVYFEQTTEATNNSLTTFQP